MSNGGTLPQEIVTDVLSRLPVKSLCRFKSVSPSWNSLISDPGFAKTHLNRTKTQNPKNLDQKIIVTTENIYSVDFADVIPTATKLDFPMLDKNAARVDVLSSCDGLLLVFQWRSRTNTEPGCTFYLLNPSTRECKKLPIFPLLHNPVSCFHSSRTIYGVGYDSSTDDYKVLMLSSYNPEPGIIGSRYITVGAVYSLKTNVWRRIQDSDYLLNGNTGGVFFNGYIHGICEKAGSESRIIVAFDLSDEIFREVPHPSSFSKYEMVPYHLRVLGGCLCLIHNRKFWMMKEYGVRDSWTEFKIRSGFFVVNLMCLLAEDEFLLRIVAEFVRELVVYNPQKDTAREIVVRGMPRASFRSTYIESLVSPHHGGRIGMQ